MSFPTIPNINPSINITAEQAVNLLLASIAFEELGLAHIINSEAEKIQFVLGTLAGQTISEPPTLGALLSIDQSVEDILRTVIKHQMLLEFKLEDLLELSTSSTTTGSTTTTTTTATATESTTTTTESTTTTTESTTTTTESTTTTTESTTTTTESTTTTTESTTTTTTSETTTTTTETTTTTTSPAVGALCTYAVFANNNFSIASQSVIDSNSQINGNMTVTHSGNTFLGNTNVVGTFTDGGGNTYQNLVLTAAPVPYPTFNSTCLQANATLVLTGDQNIASAADAVPYQGQTVWVNGNVNITGGGISITGGGIFATGTITVSGGDFTYTSTGCFALYSDSGDVRINNGPYTINGLIYTAASGGDIRLATSQGGSVCGALFSGRDIIFTGGSAIHSITNTGGCSPCVPCGSNPCLNP
ncbi:MAG: hypothetical protein ACM3QZ_03305 [Solirubrobacterales bacterium]